MSNESAPKELKFDYWMPFDIGRFLQDTMDLSTEEIGAYVLLLLRYWTRGPLPNDPVRLANISRINADAWSITYATLSMFFTVGEDGLLHQKGADRRRDEWALKRKKAHDKAVKAANARWSKRKAKPAPQPDAPSITQAEHEQCPTSVSTTNPLGDSLRSSPLPPVGTTGPSSPASNPAPAATGSKQKANPSVRAQGAPADTPDDPTPHPSASASATGGVGGKTTPPSNGSHPPKAPARSDQRYTPFLREVSRWWDGVNGSEHPCPWIDQDKRALRRFLLSAPSIALAEFQALLRNRADSEVNFKAPPRKWLADLLEFADGPLDRHKHPLRSRRQL